MQRIASDKDSAGCMGKCFSGRMLLRPYHQFKSMSQSVNTYKQTYVYMYIESERRRWDQENEHTKQETEKQKKTHTYDVIQ